METIAFRRATAQDSDLIVEAIIAAEKSNSELLSYAAIFNMKEEAVAGLLKQALEEDVHGQEICASHFVIAEVDGMAAATCASWIEGQTGAPSGQLKANMLFHLLGKETWAKAAEKLRAVSEMTIARSEGAVQLGSVYTRSAFRGRGLTSMLINEHCRLQKEEDPALTRAQLMVFKNNTKAMNAYAKSGFRQVFERTSANRLLESIFPCRIRIMMEKQL